jgi:peptidoglycan/LPS O-acetylase OafA/YrhL
VQWFLAAVLVILVGALNWDTFTRGKRGTSFGFGVAALIAALVAGITQGAEVDRPWPLVALVVFVVLTALGSRAERPRRTSQRD